MRSLMRTAVVVVALLTAGAAPALAGLPGEWEPHRTELFEVARRNQVFVHS
jgi:hypothetical protein